MGPYPVIPSGEEDPRPVRVVSRQDYWAAMGLAQRHKELSKELQMIERMVAIHVGEPEDEDGGGYFGHVSDALWDGAGIDEMLDRLNAKVEEIEEEK